MNFLYKISVISLISICLNGCFSGESEEEVDTRGGGGVSADATVSHEAASTNLHSGRSVHDFSFNPAGAPPFVSEAKTWDEVIRFLPTEDARYLQGINKNYFEAISFHSIEERNYLESAGFPMPEDWLAAKNMGDDQLKILSDAGNMKARAIYLDRLVTRASEYLPLRDTNDAAYRGSPGYSYSMSAYELSAQIQASYKSPFSGYLLGSMYSKLNYPPSPEPAIAGMFSAFDAGDKRAADILMEYVSNHPNVDVEKIMVARSATKVLQ